MSEQLCSLEFGRETYMDANVVESNKSVVQRFFAATHSGRPEVVDELVAPEVVLHGFPGGNPRNRDEYRRFFEELNAAFPGMAFDVHAMIAEGDQVAVRFSVRGVHRAPFAGIPARGKAVDFTGMVIYRLREGRICETWLQPDNVTLLRQLGALPAAA
jgi:steroid delta-isomerase-like uncharacterized protein